MNNMNILICNFCTSDKKICINIDQKVKRSCRELLGVEVNENGRLCLVCIEKLLKFQKFKEEIWQKRNEQENISTAPTQSEISKSSDEQENKTEDGSKQTVQRDIKCRKCDTNFETLDQVLIHLRENHWLYIQNPNVYCDGKYKYLCLHCGKMYLHLVNYKKHLSRLTNTMKCPNCEYKTTNKTYLNRHLRMYHSMQKNEQICLKCNRIVANIRELNQHYEEEHNTQPLLEEVTVDNEECENKDHKDSIFHPEFIDIEFIHRENDSQAINTVTNKSIVQNSSKPNTNVSNWPDSFSKPSDKESMVINKYENTHSKTAGKSKLVFNDSVEKKSTDISKTEYLNKNNNQKFDINLTLKNEGKSNIVMEENYNIKGEIPSSINSDFKYSENLNRHVTKLEVSTQKSRKRKGNKKPLSRNYIHYYRRTYYYNKIFKKISRDKFNGYQNMYSCPTKS